MPQRIQRKRTRGWRMPEGAIYVGRPTRWGNPFTVGQKIEDDACPNGYFIVTEEICLELFEAHCQIQLMDDADWLAPLRGKDLSCWCKEGQPCHADILLKLANR